MEKKIDEFNKELIKSFPNAIIEYRFSDELHKFRLNFDHYTQWLYIGRETVEDSTNIELQNLLDTYQVIKDLKENPRSKKIILTRQGTSEEPF